MQIGVGIIAMLCASGARGLRWGAELATVPAVMAAARAADIVVLGEIHDNPAHHENQAAIVAALQPAALVFEMIPQAGEDEVNALRDAGRGPGRDRGGAATGRRAAGRISPTTPTILEAAPEARVFGAGQPAADVRRARSKGRRASSARTPRPTGWTSRWRRRSRRRARPCRPRRIAARCRRSCCPAWSRRSGSATRGWPTRRSGRGR